MQRTISVFWNGGENMNPCFQLLFSLSIESLGLWDFKLKLKTFFPWLGYSNITNHEFLRGSKLTNLSFFTMDMYILIKGHGLEWHVYD
jgi:hypothetical protein